MAIMKMSTSAQNLIEAEDKSVDYLEIEKQMGVDSACSWGAAHVYSGLLHTHQPLPTSLF